MPAVSIDIYYAFIIHARLSWQPPLYKGSRNCNLYFKGILLLIATTPTTSVSLLQSSTVRQENASAGRLSICI